MKTFRSVMASREGKDVPLGAFVVSRDAELSFLCASSGIDWLVIDNEHGILSDVDVLHHVRASQAAGITPMVRVTTGSPDRIQRAMDAGAGGIIVPKVETAEQAENAVRVSRYSRWGRGMCPTVPSAGYSMAEWPRRTATMNAESVIIPLVETVAGVESVDEIVAVDGVDFIYFGPADLAQELGIDLVSDVDELVPHWKRVRDAAHSHGIAVGVPLGFAFDDGADFGAIGADLGLLRSAMEDLVKNRRATVTP